MTKNVNYMKITFDSNNWLIGCALSKSKLEFGLNQVQKNDPSYCISRCSC